MKKKKPFIGEIAIAILVALMIYVGGYGVIRFQAMGLSSHTPDQAVFRSKGTIIRALPSEAHWKIIDCYKPAFLLEAAVLGSDRVVINPWSQGMRIWGFPTWGKE